MGYGSFSKLPNAGFQNRRSTLRAATAFCLLYLDAPAQRTSLVYLSNNNGKKRAAVGSPLL